MRIEIYYITKLLLILTYMVWIATSFAYIPEDSNLLSILIIIWMSFEAITYKNIKIETILKLKQNWVTILGFILGLSMLICLYQGSLLYPYLYIYSILLNIFLLVYFNIEYFKKEFKD